MLDTKNKFIHVSTESTYIFTSTKSNHYQHNIEYQIRFYRHQLINTGSIQSVPFATSSIKTVI